MFDFTYQGFQFKRYDDSCDGDTYSSWFWDGASGNSSASLSLSSPHKIYRDIERPFCAAVHIVYGVELELQVIVEGSNAYDLLDQVIDPLWSFNGPLWGVNWVTVGEEKPFPDTHCSIRVAGEKTHLRLGQTWWLDSKPVDSQDLWSLSTIKRMLLNKPEFWATPRRAGV